MVITQGYFGNNSVQGRRVRATSALMSDGLAKVVVLCPKHGREVTEFFGSGAAFARACRDEILQDHADCTKLIA